MITDKKKVLLIFGTRPEAIKMAPIFLALKNSQIFEPILAMTGQHRELLHQALDIFGLKPDFNLEIMTEGQSIFDIAARVIAGIGDIAKSVNPVVALVHGDTTTSMAAAIACYYAKVPVGHVEAGLRSFDIYSPFPEEGNRKIISQIASLHFAPTELSEQNLKAGGIAGEDIVVTGNSALDAVRIVSERTLSFEHLDALIGGRKVVLMTAHRREIFGEKIRGVFAAIAKWAKEASDFVVVYPMHPNPNITAPANDAFTNVPNVKMLSPLSYEEMIYLLKRTYLVLTDSGGLQEEAPVFHVPVLVIREVTERPEGLAANCTKLLGTSPESVYQALVEFCSPDSQDYLKMAQAKNPFGDGYTANKILEVLQKKY